jgi:hypothetical protein
MWCGAINVDLSLMRNDWRFSRLIKDKPKAPANAPPITDKACGLNKNQQRNSRCRSPPSSSAPVGLACVLFAIDKDTSSNWLIHRLPRHLPDRMSLITPRSIGKACCILSQRRYLGCVPGRFRFRPCGIVGAAYSMRRLRQHCL